MSILLVCMMFSTYTTALHCLPRYTHTQTVSIFPHNSFNISCTFSVHQRVGEGGKREMGREWGLLTSYCPSGTSRTPLLTLHSAGLWETATRDSCLKPEYSPQSKPFQPSPANQQNLIPFASSKSIEYKIKDHI